MRPRDTRQLGTAIPREHSDPRRRLGRAPGCGAGGDTAEAHVPGAGLSGCVQERHRLRGHQAGTGSRPSACGGASLSQRVRRHSGAPANATPKGRAPPALQSSEGNLRSSKPFPGNPATFWNRVRERLAERRTTQHLGREIRVPGIQQTTGHAENRENKTHEEKENQQVSLNTSEQ